MTELLVGTKKGLFVLEGEPGAPFEVTSRHFAGEPVEFAMRDERTGRTFACVTSAFYGPKIFYTDDLSDEWQQASGVELPEDAEKPLERLWTVVPAEDDGHLYAGGAPGILFESHDGGASWELNQAFWEQPTRPDWSPGAGGMCMHSIATWPGDPSRVALAISAVGVWLTDDGGQTWRHGNKNLYPRYMPEEAREDTLDALRPQHAPRAEAARAALHAVPRRRLPLRRRGRDLDFDRGRPPVGLRVPDGGRPGRPGQRIRHPARRGHGSHDARGQGARLRDARRGRELDRARRRPPAGRRVPHDPPPGVLRRGLGARRWASTSARRRATSSGRGTRARRGSRRRRTCRRCTRCARPRDPETRRTSGRCAPTRASPLRGATCTSRGRGTSSRAGRSGRSRPPR